MPTPFDHRITDILPLGTRPRRVAIVGLGSLGSYVAFIMACIGVEVLSLIDGERLEAGNVCRHMLGHSSVGLLKVEAMATLLRDHAPTIDVRSYPFHIEHDLEATRALIADHDLTVACTDEYAAQLLVNQCALETKKPAIFATCGERAITGHAILVEPDSNYGCFWCSEAHFGAKYVVHRADEDRYASTLPWAALPNFIHAIAGETAWLAESVLAAQTSGHTLPMPPGPYLNTTFVAIRSPEHDIDVPANTRRAAIAPIHPLCIYCRDTGRGSPAVESAPADSHPHEEPENFEGFAKRVS